MAGLQLPYNRVFIIGLAAVSVTATYWLLFRTGAGLRILLSHGPHHFGWAQHRGFDLVLAGHLHGGQIRLPLLGSVCGGRYEAGTFQRGRTVMHVSRGLGQIAPVRFGCPPEITKLVLRAGGRG